MTSRKRYVFNDPEDMAEGFQAIANCAFCGLPATYKAGDNTPLCKDCAMYYKPTRTPQADKEEK
jgi:hypothetical protein